MPRAALKVAGLLLVTAALPGPLAGQGRAPDPHMDPTLVPAGCLACHRGHGVSQSPMMATPQLEVCLACHGSEGDRTQAEREGRLSPQARPPLLGAVLKRPSAHRLSARVFRASGTREVTCSSCHAPHSAPPGLASAVAVGQKRPSPRNEGEFEYELCESCHGNRGASTVNLGDISRLFDPENRSYHPVHAPAREGSPSVVAALAGREINCTDCHGNSDSRGPRGPHGSNELGLLVAANPTVDGAGDSPLCDRCHRREDVLASSSFPEHGRHVLKIRAACATCHTPHGSLANRALIRFGEETSHSTVAPSLKTGRLAYESDVPGQGSCELTCHGVDHAPATYGAAAFGRE